MRTLLLAGLAGLALSACATKPKQVAIGCAPLSPSAEADVIFPTVAKTFGKQAQGYIVLVDSRATDTRGDIILQLKGIAPAPNDPPVAGERLTVVVQRCTHKVLRVSRPA